MPSSSVATDSDYVAPHLLTEKNPTSVHQFMGHIKPDTEPVWILMNDVTFRIPRNYLMFLYKVMPSSPVTFTALTFYPDFAGAKVEFAGERLTEENKIWNWKYSPNLIEIIGMGEPLPKANQILFDAEKNEPDHPWQYGLLKSLKKSWKIADAYFVRPSEANPAGYRVSCIINELEMCTVEIPISPKVYVAYRFHRGLLPHWQEIHEKVTALVQSFIVKKE